MVSPDVLFHLTTFPIIAYDPQLEILARSPTHHLGCRMPIPIQCSCGRSMRIKDEMAGRKVRCPECKQVLAVPSSTENEVEDEALRILTADSPEPKPLPSPEEMKSSAIEERRSPSPAPQIPRSALSVGMPTASAKPKTRPSKSTSDRAGFGIAVHPSIIAGALMMIGAAVWFFLGLAAGIIYFYPPILFVLGIGAVIRGFTGQD